MLTVKEMLCGFLAMFFMLKKWMRINRMIFWLFEDCTNGSGGVGEKDNGCNMCAIL